MKFFEKENKLKKEPISICLMKNGKILKMNKFETQRGVYIIYNILYNGDIYFVKLRDGDRAENILEAVNLSKISRK